MRGLQTARTTRQSGGAPHAAIVRSRWRFWVLGVVLCGALLASGPGNAGAASPGMTRPVKAWSAAICSGFARWQQYITRLASTGPVGGLLHATGGPSDPEAIRLGIPVFLGNVVVATDRLASDVSAAGVPKIKNGVAIAASFASIVQFLGGQFGAFKIRAEQIGPNQPGPQFSESEDLPGLLQAADTAFPTTLSQTAAANPMSRLTKTFASTKACKPLL